MIKNVYVVGGNGFAKECYQHIMFMHYKDPEINFVGFLGHNGYKVDFGNLNEYFKGDLSEFEFAEDDYAVIGAGYPELRRKIYNDIKAKENAKFLTSIANVDKLGQLDLPQFAFVGRSNVGKSSLLNALTNRKSLAKTSSTPGRTRLINVFEINSSFYFVDLPGYGFAKASKSEQAGWQKLIGTYLENSKNLKLVFVLLDCRHDITEKDEQMLEYLYTYQIPFQIIVTKTDKLNKSELRKNLQILATQTKVGLGDIIAVSSTKKTNLDAILKLIEEKLTKEEL